MNKYEILKNMIDHSRKVVFFTGAGISVPSGIPDFRSEKGIYNGEKVKGYSPEQIISHSFYESHKDDFYDFYKKKMMYLSAKPNLAHYYIAQLQNDKDVTVITQNIDGLHQEAGSNFVLELHGSIHRNYCEKCGEFYDGKFVHDSKGVPHCEKCGGDIKPDVVLYEEPLNEEVINDAIREIMTCDTLIIVGTSLTVYPAAGFIRYFKGNALIVINKDETSLDNMCDLVINDDCVNVFEHLI